MHGMKTRLKHMVRMQLPNCPSYFVEEVALRMATLPDMRQLLNMKKQPKKMLFRTIEKTSLDVIRHQLTDYDDLLDVKGMTRDEARLIVEDEVLEQFHQWAGS